jgi:hypothetical protein
MKIKLAAYILMSVLFFSCNEYQPFIECTINGSSYKIEGIGVVLAAYTGGTSSVGGNGTPYAINIRFNTMIPGTYDCGPGGLGTIEIFNQTSSQTFSSNNAGGSGTIEALTAGSNLIEGYFSGTLKNSSGTEQLVVTNGTFSGRAY